MENGKLRLDLQELQLERNNLQQLVLQQKLKIKELKDTILTLAQSEEATSQLSGLVAQNQDLKKRCQELADACEKAHLENEALRAKAQEWEENSFARGAGAFMSAGGKGFGGAGDLASSIDRMSEDIDINLPPSEAEKQLQQRVATLEDEVNQYKKQLDSARSQQSKQQTSLTNMSQQEQAEDDLKHLKPVVVQYLSQLPLGPPKSEALFNVMCSMLKIDAKEQ